MYLPAKLWLWLRHSVCQTIDPSISDDRRQANGTTPSVSSHLGFTLASSLHASHLSKASRVSRVYCFPLFPLSSPVSPISRPLLVEQHHVSSREAGPSHCPTDAAVFPR